MTDKQYSRRAARRARRDARRAKRQERWNNFKSWWQDKVVDNFHSDTRDSSEGLGRFLNGVDNLWNRITGSGLTDSQREANQYSAAMAEQQYNREVEFYEKYQSPKAMMQQGVNPFGINGSAGGHTASGGSPQSVSPAPAEGVGGMLGLVQSIFGMVQQKRSVDSQVALNKSSESRNYSEANERNINASSLADMNAAEIMQKLSNVEINSANVKLISSKVLNTQQDTLLKEQQINKLASEILNIDADTNVKAEQLNVMLSQIANMDADTDLKRKQFDKLVSDILVNSKSLDVMSAQISLMGTQAGVNKNQQIKLQHEWEKLKQDYDRDEIANVFNSIILSQKASDASWRDPSNYDGIQREVRAFLNEFEDTFSLSIGR